MIARRGVDKPEDRDRDGNAAGPDAEAPARRHRTVYKYCSLAGDCLSWRWELLVHGVLYFPTPAELNDPYEGRLPNLNVTEEGARQFWRSNHARSGGDPAERDRFVEDQLRLPNALDPAVWQSIWDGLGEDAQQVGIVSFTAEEKSIPMWSLYADSHRGICIRFELPQASDDFGTLFEVQYADEFPGWQLGDPDHDFFITTFTTKSSHWAQEREWRLIDHEREPRKILTPYPISGVILGPRISPMHAEIIKGWVRDSGKDVEIHRAVLRPGAYAVDIVPNDGGVL